MSGTPEALTDSGASADSSLYEVMERRWCVNPDVQHRHGIIYDRRFRDDIIIVSSDREQVVPFLRGMVQRAACIFRLDIVKIEPREVEMLGLLVTLDGGRVEVLPELPSERVPLLRGSAHPPSVLRSWPRAYLHSLRHLCSSHVFFEQVSNQVIEQMAKFFTDPTLIRELRQEQANPRAVKKATEPGLWLIWGFHTRCPPYPGDRLPRAPPVVPIPLSAPPARITPSFLDPAQVTTAVFGRWATNPSKSQWGWQGPRPIGCFDSRLPVHQCVLLNPFSLERHARRRG